MDEMKLTSGFARGLVSKLAKKLIKSKLDVDVGIQLNAIEATMIDGKTHVHLDLDAELEKDELLKIISQIGLL